MAAERLVSSRDRSSGFLPFVAKRVRRTPIRLQTRCARPSPGIGGLNLRLKDDMQTDLTVSRDRARLLKARLGY